MPRQPPVKRSCSRKLAKVPVARTLKTGELLYRVGENLPMVVMTSQDRVVCWARAFPRSENQWMVFLFYSVGSQSRSIAGQQVIPLPDGCQRIQRIQDPGGQTWVGFRGTGPLLEGQRHFDRWFADQDWKVRRDWWQSEGAWQAVFGHPSKKTKATIWVKSQKKDTWDGMLFLESRNK